MDNANSAAYFLMRLMMCGIWLPAGIHKITNSGFHMAGMELHGLTFATGILFAVVVAIELGGSLLMLLNRYVWIVALAWMAFLIPASLLYHTGWVGEFGAGNIIGEPPHFAPFADMVSFFKNVSIFGGLLALLILDPSKPAWLANRVGGRAPATAS